MKVLLRRNVTNLGKIGEVVEVKPGFARNYLLPERLAVEPTKGNLKAVEAEKQKYLEQIARERADLQVKAAALEGKEISIAARANVEGHLYGSIGPAQIVAALAEQNIFVEAQHILLENAIRQVEKYDVRIRFAEDILSTIHVQVTAIHEEGDDQAAQAPKADDEDKKSDE